MRRSLLHYGSPWFCLFDDIIPLGLRHNARPLAFCQHLDKCFILRFCGNAVSTRHSTEYRSVLFKPSKKAARVGSAASAAPRSSGACMVAGPAYGGLPMTVSLGRFNCRKACWLCSTFLRQSSYRVYFFLRPYGLWPTWRVTHQPPFAIGSIARPSIQPKQSANSTASATGTDGMLDDFFASFIRLLGMTRARD